MAVFGMSPFKKFFAHPFRALSALSVSILTAANLATMTPAGAGECGRNHVGAFRYLLSLTAGGKGVETKSFILQNTVGFCISPKNKGVIIYGTDIKLGDQDKKAFITFLRRYRHLANLPVIDYNSNEILTLGAKPRGGADTEALAVTRSALANINKVSAPVVRTALADVRDEARIDKRVPLPPVRPFIVASKDRGVDPARFVVASNAHKTTQGKPASSRVVALPPEMPAEILALRAQDEARIARAEATQKLEVADHQDAVAALVADVQTRDNLQVAAVVPSRSVDGDRMVDQNNTRSIEETVVAKVQPRAHVDDAVMMAKTEALVGQATSFVPLNEIASASASLFTSSFGGAYSAALAKPNNVAVAALYPAVFRPEDLIVDGDAPQAAVSSLNEGVVPALPQVFERMPVRDTLAADLMAAKKGIGKGEILSATVSNVWRFVPRVPAVG